MSAVNDRPTEHDVVDVDIPAGDQSPPAPAHLPAARKKDSTFPGPARAPLAKVGSSDFGGDHSDFPISMVRHARDTNTTNVSFRAILSDIATGEWRTQVAAVRAAYAKGGKEAADEPKKKLPAVLFSGTFTRRASDALIQHSGLICVDLDNLGTQLPAIREHIESDPHTLAVFVSPTGTGLKVIFRCSPDRPHSHSFHAAERYMLEHFGLEIDPACKDVSRLCFVSYDPETFIAEHAEVLPEPDDPVEFKAPHESKPGAALSTGDEPWEDFDRRVDFPALITAAGWKHAGGKNWTRPGKAGGVSATWDKVPGRFYVFSSSTEFEANHVYRPWHVYSILHHRGNWSEAVAQLRRDGYGAQRAAPLRDPPPDELADLKSLPAGGPERPGVRAPSSRPLMSLTATGEERGAANLLGNGFLRRGQGALFVGATGIGKSSFLLQAAIRWSLGEPLFGIRPSKPLTIMIAQAENDDIDLVEMRDGVLAGLNLSEVQKEAVRLRVHVMTVHSRGIELLGCIEPEVERLAIDLLILDPAFAYVPGAVRDQECVTFFLRALLQPFIVKHNLGAIVAHHSNKPPSGKEKSTWQGGDFAYAGSGSIEFANWARGVVYLRSIGSTEVFELRGAKRGKRLGLCDEHGHAVATLHVRHARNGGIFWELADAGDVQRAAGDPSTAGVFAAFHGMRHETDGGVSVEKLAAKVRESKRTLNRRFAAGNRLAGGNGEALVRREGRVFLDEENG